MAPIDQTPKPPAPGAIPFLFARKPKGPRGPGFLKAFGRSQISSALATVADYAFLFGLTEFFHVWYVASVAAGAVAGAATNFLINRKWTFEAEHGQWQGQTSRYVLVSGGSLVLNTGGVWALTELTHFHYAISVAVVGLLVGIFFNFPLQRHYVFK